MQSELTDKVIAEVTGENSHSDYATATDGITSGQSTSDGEAMSTSSGEKMTREELRKSEEFKRYK